MPESDILGLSIPYRDLWLESGVNRAAWEAEAARPLEELESFVARLYADLSRVTGPATRAALSRAISWRERLIEERGKWDANP